MIRPVKIKALENYRVWIKYSDGQSGEIDLSNYVGKGIFKLWKDEIFFQTVHIGNSGEIAWGTKIDLCPDALYMKLTQKTPEQLFPNLKEEKVDA